MNSGLAAGAILKGLLWGLALYAGLCLAVYLAQRRLMYFPERSTEPEALQLAARLGLRPWRDGDGTLLGWRGAGASTGKPRALVLHGNAGDALGRADYLPVLAAAGFEGVLAEYPGYGPRSGDPTEASLTAEGLRALRRLKAESTAPVILVGESLGSGVAVQVARAEPAQVAGLLLPVPFASMVEVGARHYPYLPLRALVRDRWDSLEAIRCYAGPVAILVAERDEVVTAAQGRRLAQGCRGPVRVWEAPGAPHNGLPREPGRPPWSEALAFLRQAAGMRE
jgi:pimeloyl-ACP methyl ester carboxylesterase